MLDTKTFIRALKHQKFESIAVMLLILLAGLFVIQSLPSIYVSTAKIVIERTDMFTQAEQSGGNAESVGHRMRLIISMVLSSESVRDMLVEHGLVSPDVSETDLEVASKAFRGRANLTFDNVAVVNQYTGKSGLYSQGLDITFEDESPETAFAVAQSLTDRVLDANRGKAEMAIEVQRSFLVEQRREAFKRLSEAREDIAAFKNENASYLPELQALAIRRYEEIEAENYRTQESIAQLNRDLDEIRGHLATTSADAFVLAADGTRILGAEEQLRLLEAEYARARSRYSAQHPTAIRLRTELQALRAHTGGGKTSGIEADLQEARKELSVALERYSDDHPDVRRLRTDIARLEALLSVRPGASRPKQASSASNPAYNRLVIREQSILDHIGREQQKLASLERRLADLDVQLARMPAVEKHLDTLTQKQERVEATYQEIDAELEKLSLSSGRREADLLDRYVVLEAPRLPTAPSKPRKMLLLLVLILLSGTAGLLAALVLHLYRDRILDSDDVEELLDVPVYIVPKCT